MANTWDRVPIEPQTVNAPLSRAAIFLVVRIAESDEALAAVRDVISDIGGLVRAVGFRDLGGQLSCIVGIGRAAWDRLGQPSRPKQLHPLAAVQGATHTAVSTPGDLLFHIRADAPDMCFELERLLV